jgi:cell division protein FtsZ
VERLLAHPLLEGGQVLNEAAGILVCIAGGIDLGWSEVDRIMEQINRHGEQAHIILGAAIDETLGDRLTVTVVASRREGNEERTGAPNGPERPPEEASASSGVDRPELPWVDASSSGRASSRYVAPPPVLTLEKAEQLMTHPPNGKGQGRSRKGGPRLHQGQLPLQIVSKGRFEKSEPTIYHGQDLDVPTYIRRGVPLN